MTKIQDVEELIVRSGVVGGARAVSSGGVRVHMDLRSGESSESWVNVWSSMLGPGSYSMDGLHVHFNKQEVLGIRLGSVPASDPTFVGWGEVVFHFGRMAGSGAVKVSASSVLEAVAGEAVVVQTEAVSVAAGGVVDVSGGEAVTVTTEAVSVQSVSLEASSETVSVTSEQLEVFSGGAISVSSGTTTIASTGRSQCRLAREHLWTQGRVW